MTTSVKKRPQSITRINTQLESFLARQFGYENVDFYEQESCIQDNHHSLFVGKFQFRLLIVCNDRIYLADNPPKNLDNFICFDDIVDITTIDDVPKFLTGVEKENSLHICIRYYKNAKRKKKLLETKKKLVELKKSIVYAKTIDNKLAEIELSTPRTYRSLCSNYLEENNLDLTNRSFLNLDYLNQLTSRSAPDYYPPTPHGAKHNRELELTNRTTNRSVRFENEDSLSNDSLKVDYLTDQAVNQRYKTLIQMVNKIEPTTPRNAAPQLDDQDRQVFNLNLPMTPRSIDGLPLSNYSLLNEEYSDEVEDGIITKQTSKNIEFINDEINKSFIRDAETTESLLHIYVLNSKTTIFQTLKNAHFYTKIRSTLNYHNSTEEEETKNKLAQKLIKSRNFEKKFKQLKNEIAANIHDLDAINELYDELLYAVNDHHIIKKMFWHTSELYKLTVEQLNAYLPHSPATLDSNLTLGERRVKELDCSIVMIETLSVMFSETEFLPNRNELLYEEKCKHLRNLIESLIADPIIPDFDDDFYHDSITQTKRKLKSLLLDLTLVTAILLWEILHFLGLTSWNSKDFNLDMCIRLIEASSNLEKFIAKIIGELTKIINDTSEIVLSPKKTIIVFKIFSFLLTIIEKSSSKLLKNLIKTNYQEEFKYYFNEDRMKLKSFNYYPITNDLLKTIKKLEQHIL